MVETVVDRLAAQALAHWQPPLSSECLLPFWGGGDWGQWETGQYFSSFEKLGIWILYKISQVLNSRDKFLKIHTA